MSDLYTNYTFLCKKETLILNTFFLLLQKGITKNYSKKKKYKLNIFFSNIERLNNQSSQTKLN